MNLSLIHICIRSFRKEMANPGDFWTGDYTVIHNGIAQDQSGIAVFSTNNWGWKYEHMSSITRAQSLLEWKQPRDTTQSIFICQQLATKKTKLIDDLEEQH